MRTRTERVWAGLLLIGLSFAAGAKAQQRPITELDVSPGLTATGTSFGGGKTGPIVGLSVTPGGITNSMLQNSSVTINTGTGLSGGGALPLGGTLSLTNTGVTSFNSRAGAVAPVSGDYTFSLIGGTATKSQIPGTTAYTDAANSFTANQSITGDLSVTGRLHLPGTISASVGVITLGVDQSNNPVPFIHNYGTIQGNATSGNTWVGQNAGNFHTGVTTPNTVLGNTGVGQSALTSNGTGTGNTAVGYLGLVRNTSGFLNTAIGLQALFANETGSSNTALGFEALELNVSGYNNIGIGVGTGDVLGSGSNNNDIYIGNGVGAVENNTIRIGSANCNPSCQTKTFIAGITGVTTDLTGAVPVLVDTNGQLGTATSSRRFKYDIQNMDETTKNLLRLRPVTFRYKQAQNDGSHPLQYGLIAEEVADVYPELVQFDPKTGEPNTVLYHVLPAMLLNEFQKQQQQIEAQQEQIRSLQEQLAQLVAQTRQLQTDVTTFK